MAENTKFEPLTEGGDGDESCMGMEQPSSKDIANAGSTNRQERGATFAVYPPSSSPTFDQHDQAFDRNDQAFDRSRNAKKRLVSKSGSLKVTAKNVRRKTQLYLADIFTTMIDLRWSWVILIFCASYVLSWVVFGLLWWIVVAVRGPSVCATEVYDWTSAFLFSIETEQTIGYGSRSITTACAEATIILQLQSLVGLLLDAFLLGLTFAKLSRPREREKTVMFSENAVIAPRDGKMCLMCRVGDIRKSQIVDASIRMQLFRKWTTKEGKEIPFYQEDLKVCYDWRNPDNDFRNELFLILPMVIIHVIDKNSPFYDMTPEKIQDSEFELVVVMDGIVEHTGMNTQPKTSYVSDEILWGYDFADVIDRSHLVDGKFFVDFSKLNNTYQIDMPLCSPKEYYEREGLFLSRESIDGPFV